MEDEVQKQAKVAASHRASYILEFGTWRATCRTCGYTVRNPQRRQAASIFRMHIRDARLIDLSDPVGLEAGLAAIGIDISDSAAALAPATDADPASRLKQIDATRWGLTPDGAVESAADRRLHLTQ